MPQLRRPYCPLAEPIILPFSAHHPCSSAPLIITKNIQNSIGGKHDH